MCASVLAIGVVIGVLFLEETHDCKKHRRDLGLETGKFLLRKFQGRPKPVNVNEVSESNYEAHEILLEDEAPPGYCTTEGSPRQPSSRSHSPMAAPADLKPFSKQGTRGRPQGVHKAFTKQVILTIAGFGLLA